jgi:hypothetical protein
VRARQLAHAALSTSTRGVQSVAALALALAGSVRPEKQIADHLARRFPLDTLIASYWLPTIRAAIQLQRNEPAKAIDFLRRAASYELSTINTTPRVGGASLPSLSSGSGLFVPW